MNILQETEVTPQSPAQDVAESIRMQIKGTWNRILMTHQRGMAAIWNELPEGTTPQDVLDELGTDAADVFTLSAALATLIGSIDADAVVHVPEGVTVTANADGTVTLS